MIVELIDGKKYWCSKHTMESEGYIYSPVPPCTPWQGILQFAPDWIKTRHMIIHSFHPESLELDYDSNACAVVSESDLFETYEEAKQDFIKQANLYVKDREAYLEDYKKFIDKFSQEATEETRWFIEP